jgi:hypothetical protein
MRNSIYLIAVLYLVFLPSLFCQDMAEPKIIIGKINEHYSGATKFRTKVLYHLYKDHVSNELIETDSAVILRSDAAILFKMGNIETLSDGQYDLLIDHTDKVVVVDNGGANPNVNRMIPSLDSLLTRCSHYQSSAFGSIGCLYLGLIEGEAKGVSICYHLSDNSLYSLTTYYRNERKIGEGDDGISVTPRLEIRYVQTDRSPQIDVRKMQYSWYCRKSGKAFKPSENYRNYKIINQIIE